MTLHDAKTGRHWPCASQGQAYTMARHLGLTDWTLCPSWAPEPPTIRETTDASRRVWAQQEAKNG